MASSSSDAKLQADLYWEVLDKINKHRIARRNCLAIKELNIGLFINDLTYKYLSAKNDYETSNEYTPFSDAARILAITYSKIGTCQAVLDSRLYCNEMLIQMLEAKDRYKEVTGTKFEDLSDDYNFNVRSRKYNS